jgi:hypothetical protein
MRRRDLIVIAAGASAVWPLIAVASPRKVPLIVVLIVQSPGSEPFWRGLKEALRDLGYIEGQKHPLRIPI